MEWLKGLTRKDWYHNGHACSQAQWDALDWSKAYVDMGPSPMGNLGPYWHVPNIEDECVARLYPKLLATKWVWVVRQAIIEMQSKPATPENREP